MEKLASLSLGTPVSLGVWCTGHLRQGWAGDVRALRGNRFKVRIDAGHRTNTVLTFGSSAAAVHKLKLDDFIHTTK